MDAVVLPRTGAAKDWARALSNIATLRGDSRLTLAAALDKAAQTFGPQTALVSELSHLTYAQLTSRKNQYARWALAEGLRPGDVVAIMMANSAEYVAVWLGLTQVGCVAALLNTNQQGSALSQAIETVQPKRVVAEREFAAALTGTSYTLPKAPVYVRSAGQDDAAGCDEVLDPTRFNDRPLMCHEQPRIVTRQTALLIFTSGTTGLPKAAKVSHYRLLEWSLWFAGMMNLGPMDSLYNCLPLYHSTGGVVGIGSVLMTGGTVVIRRRFSARRFWDDVVANRCTHFLYIGELCRYLVAAPYCAAQTRHNLILCCGNGLRKDMWEAFAERFGIPRILEFYASTEGNVSLYNCEGRPGAIGRIPAFLSHRFPIALIELETDTNEPRRDTGGHCIPCLPGDAGEAIGEVRSTTAPGPQEFEGYMDESATERKILRDVFKAGDAWFRTGDLMRRDAAGFFYFVDRIGDTFRWKGENVSTAQVAEALCQCRGVTGAAVYGVKMPAKEGRAGMAAITVDNMFDPALLFADLTARVPSYARPLFLRLRESLEMTGTFKPVKAQLMAEGYDPAGIDDPLYIMDTTAGTYRRFNASCASGGEQDLKGARFGGVI